ncbi:MAG: tRNA uridine-5-carboxymethylaminomethyl(34) synthesis enzyme MnmG [Desulfohalobiaceae bacterium]|nr:tRNA uridine-5-carboxymethylaminomethyl(34) synthesis enzyme MnmG [Desulfohalobiaceae bacterium]
MGFSYDIIVVGAGHAGCEAALAAARMGCSTALFGINLDTAGHMPCSPSVGGIGKGHLVKEIDALGGHMGRITDQTAIQFRRLNTRKGPAVRGTRTQNDKERYRALMKHTLERQSRLSLKQALITSLLLQDGRVAGVADESGTEYAARAVVLAGGTFFRGMVHLGTARIESGRAGELPANRLPDQLRDLGLRTGRMKTGTPARLNRRSIDFSRLREQFGDLEPRPFSLHTEQTPKTQISCFFGRTNERSHQIIRENLHLSPLYDGSIQGVSARYCPSIEDKIVKFPDRSFHNIILEPEGLDTEEIYVSGTGNSLPPQIQEDFVHSIEGLEEAEIMRPAYAIEYDYIQPQQLWRTLETRTVPGLYLAGQVNGTSGYEEAAAQGLWAGINAALRIQGRPPFLLDRSQAYMGVMIDDLVLKGANEPYRMFTSRAEYRLLLREDNADLRLLQKGYELGLHEEKAYKDLQRRLQAIRGEVDRLRSIRVTPGEEINSDLAGLGSSPLSHPVTLDKLLKRPELDYTFVKRRFPPQEDLSRSEEEQVEIEVKYEGYLDRQKAEADKFRQTEHIAIPGDLCYEDLPGLSNEVRQKLREHEPATLGQASRIPGMTPAALSLLRVFIQRRSRERE